MDKYSDVIVIEGLDRWCTYLKSAVRKSQINEIFMIDYGRGQ